MINNPLPEGMIAHQCEACGFLSPDHYASSLALKLAKAKELVWKIYTTENNVALIRELGDVLS